jgi:MATE family multidrug resistance protein
MLYPVRAESWHLGPLRRMFRLGAPIGAQQVLEFGAFAVVALMMGWIGTREMAGHQIAINLAALTFMVPLGVGDAASVLVGRAVGRGDPVGTRAAARAAFACGAAFMSLTGAAFLTVPGALAQLYTRDPAVIAVAVILIRIAGVFQVFDGLQVVGAGILRGLGDTRAPMLICLIGYWLLGIPVSAYLAFGVGLGPPGLWWGLVLGLAIVALLLLARVRSRLAARQTRVVIDGHTLPATGSPDMSWVDAREGRQM